MTRIGGHIPLEIALYPLANDIVEYWDGGSLKVFRGTVTMTPDDKSKPAKDLPKVGQAAGLHTSSC